LKGNEAHGRTGRPPEETKGTLRTRRRSKALKQVVLPARDGRGISETGCLCPKRTRHRRRRHVYTLVCAVSGRSTAPAPSGGHTSESAGLRTLLGVNGEATNGGHDVGGSSRAHRSIGPREQGSAKAIFRDGLRPTPTFTRQRAEGKDRMKRSIGHQCPGTSQVASRRDPPLGTGNAQELSGGSVTLVRKCEGRSPRGDSVPYERRQLRLSATSLVSTAKVVRHTRRTA